MSRPQFLLDSVRQSPVCAECVSNLSSLLTTISSTINVYIYFFKHRNFVLGLVFPPNTTITITEYSRTSRSTHRYTNCLHLDSINEKSSYRQFDKLSCCLARYQGAKTLPVLVLGVGGDLATPPTLPALYERFPVAGGGAPGCCTRSPPSPRTTTPSDSSPAPATAPSRSSFELT